MGREVFWLLFLGCCFYDAFRSVPVTHTVQPEAEMPVPPPKSHTPGVSLVTDDPDSPPSKSGYLSVDLCLSCGYKKRFEELRNPHTEQELQEELPMVTVVAGEYPLPTPTRLIGEFLNNFKFIFIVFVLFGDWIKEKTGFELPRYDWIKNNKLQAGLLVFTLCSFGGNYFLTSGAFEASYNGVMIFSKLKVGRMPHPGEIAAIIKSIPS